MIHKAFILGAGLGTRLRPLTHVLPKPLVPIFHEPMANYALRHCQAAGVSEFAINTHHLPESWHATYPESKFNGCSLHFFHEKILLETGGGIQNIASFIGNDPLLIYNGDILTNIDIHQLIHQHKQSGDLATLALRSSGENCNVSISGNKVSDMRNILSESPGTHQFTGIYCIQPEILQLIPPHEVVSVVPAFIELIKTEKLGAIVLDEGDWFDIGNPQAYREIHAHMRNQREDAIHPEARIHPDASVCQKTCIIGPHVEVQAGACLKNTIVWPGVHIPANTQADGQILTGEN